MHHDEFNELAGRIQGLGDFVLGLTAELEIQGTINGERFSQRLEHFAGNRYFDGEHLDATKRTLSELNRFLIEARQRRQQTQSDDPRHYRQRKRYK